MDIKRIGRHFLTTRYHLNSTFPPRVLKAIGQAIKSSEAGHSGELRIVIEPALDSLSVFNGVSARERAIELFSQFRVWDTEHNSGVLIYLLLADRAVEIVADRGIHARVGEQQWTEICNRMRADFKNAAYEAGVLTGIQSATALLVKNFPATGVQVNELPDSPVVL